MVDWNLAGRIAGGGFSSVFITLLTLAASVWLISFIIRRAAGKNKKIVSGSSGDSAQPEIKQQQHRSHT